MKYSLVSSIIFLSIVTNTHTMEKENNKITSPRVSVSESPKSARRENNPLKISDEKERIIKVSPRTSPETSPDSLPRKKSIGQQYGSTSDFAVKKDNLPNSRKDLHLKLAQLTVSSGSLSSSSCDEKK